MTKTNTFLQRKDIVKTNGIIQTIDHFVKRTGEYRYRYSMVNLSWQINTVFIYRYRYVDLDDNHLSFPGLIKDENEYGVVCSYKVPDFWNSSLLKHKKNVTA